MRHFAHMRDAITAAVLGGVFVTVAACSDTSTESVEDNAFTSVGEDDDARGSTSAGGEPDADTDGGDVSTSGDADDDGFTTGEGESSGGDDDGGTEPAPEVGPHALCPDELPEGWIFCEDFEDSDPFEVFFDYVDGEGNFVPEHFGGASGVGAMRAHYREGSEAAGFLSVSFGTNPINGADRPGYAGDTHFDEIYWRFRVKMQPGWPDVGPHNLTRVSAFAQSDWGQAMVAAITSDGDQVPLRASASTCVDADQVACSGIDDAASLEPLGAFVGTTPVFSSERAGRWQCVEAHVRLNTPGNTDGVFEFWVDGEREAGDTNLDWRGNWTEFGLNLLSIENFWAGGAPADLDRWFDDLVISTAPIGC
jgi:hypothetical protein